MPNLLILPRTKIYSTCSRAHLMLFPLACVFFMELMEIQPGSRRLSSFNMVTGRPYLHTEACSQRNWLDNFKASEIREFVNRSQDDKNGYVGYIHTKRRKSEAKKIYSQKEANQNRYYLHRRMSIKNQEWHFQSTSTFLHQYPMPPSSISTKSLHSLQYALLVADMPNAM